MKFLSVHIVQFVDDSQPGWVRCTFNDIHGKQWSIVEKVPIVTADWLDIKSRYPQRGVIPCQIMEEHIDQANIKVLTIDIGIPLAIETEDGQTRFEVFADQIIEET